MQIEINQEFKKSNDEFVNDKGQVVAMITPDINEDYYLLRVHMYKDQYINAFPKMATIGIGFAIEKDWNVNLRYQNKAEIIANHIFHNRKYKQITKKMVIEAIQLLQKEIVLLKHEAWVDQTIKEMKNALNDFELGYLKALEDSRNKVKEYDLEVEGGILWKTKRV